MSRFVTAALALAACLTVGQATALAWELPPVAGVGYPNVPIDRGKKVSAFFGYSYGQDSNILRAASGSVDEKKDNFQEALIGVVFVTGVPSRSFDVRYEGKLEYFEKETEYNYNEHAVKASVVLQTEKTSLTGRATYDLLAEAPEIEAEGLLARQRIFGAADLGLRKGQLELSAGYSLGDNKYDNREGDFTDQFLNTELRLWRGETKHYFAHFDMGEVQYAGTASQDFTYRRLYLGLRSERTARSALEIAAGVQGNDTTFDVFASVQEEFFASVRTTWLMQNGRGALVLGYTRGGEASLISDNKSVSRLTVRYSFAANTRLSLTAGLTNEAANFTDFVYDPLDPPPDDMSRLAWDAGIIYEIGSPERLHGRLFVSYGTESRTGPSTPTDYNYARTRWFGGLALVY